MTVGVLGAFASQALLASRWHLPPLRLLAVSAVASIVGLAGAKLYYLAEHRGEEHPVETAGLAIQGFVVACMATLAVGGTAARLPVGSALDATAPGLLFGMAVGRVGCFLTGCCAGGPTGARWGIWSSDRRIGARRIPTQLLESALAGFVGRAALATVLTTVPRPAGTVFVGAAAGYTLGRQLLFPFRDDPRNTRHGRITVASMAMAVIAADLAVAILG